MSAVVSADTDLKKIKSKSPQGDFRFGDFFSLGKKHKVSIIEISEEWLKVAMVEQRGGKRKIIGIATEGIKDISEIEVSDKISQSYKKNGFKPDEVLILHPTNNLTTRILSLPSTDPKEIADIVELQAVKQTPYTKDEITTGYSVVDSDDTGYSRILLAISHREVASRYLRTVEIAGLSVDHITIALEGTQSWLKAVKAKDGGLDEDFKAVLDVDWLSTDFIVFQGDKVIYARSISLGAKQISESGPLAEMDMFREVQRSLESGNAELKGGKINQIYVTGVPSALKNLPPLFSRELSLPCSVLSAFHDLEKQIQKKAIEYAQNATCSLVPLLGFALNVAVPQINLIPPEIRIRKNLEDRAKDLAVLGTLLLALVTIASAVSFEKIYTKNKYVEGLRKEYQGIRAESEDVERYVAKMRLAQEHMNAGGGFLDVLKDITDVLPDNIYLTSFQFNAKEKTLMIRGISEEMSAVFQVLSTLEATPHLEFVKTKNVTKRKINEREAAEFEIVANIIEKTPLQNEEAVPSV